MADELIRAVELLGEVFDLDLIRREWLPVAVGEESRTAWLEDAFTRLVPAGP